MAKKNDKRKRKTKEKTVEKRVERKETTFLERTLASVLPSDEIAAMAADVIGFGMDAASAFDPTPMSGLAIAAGRATGLFSVPRKQQLYAPQFMSSYKQRPSKGISSGPPVIDRRMSILHSVVIPRRLGALRDRHLGGPRTRNLRSEAIPFAVSGGVGLANYHETFPLEVKGALGEWHSIESRQFITRLPNTASAGEILASIPIDVSAGALAHTRLAELAGLYGRLKWNHVAFVLAPTCSAATEGAVSLAAWTDPAHTLADFAEGDERINAALTMEENCKNSQLWEAVALVPDEIETPRFQDQTTGHNETDIELRQTAAGRLELMALSSWATTGSPGLVYLEASLIGQNDVASTQSRNVVGSTGVAGELLHTNGSALFLIGSGHDDVQADVFTNDEPLILPIVDKEWERSDGSFQFNDQMVCSQFAAAGSSPIRFARTGLYDLGWKLTKMSKNAGGHCVQAVFKVPHGVWAVNTGLGSSNVLCVTPGYFAFVTGEPHSVAIVELRNDQLNFGAGKYATVSYELYSTPGADMVRLVRFGSVAFNSTDLIVTLSAARSMNDGVAGSPMPIDPYVASKLLRDPTGSVELGPRIRDSGEAAYMRKLTGACDLTAEESELVERRVKNARKADSARDSAIQRFMKREREEVLAKAAYDNYALAEQLDKLESEEPSDPLHESHYDVSDPVGEAPSLITLHERGLLTTAQLSSALLRLKLKNESK